MLGMIVFKTIAKPCCEPLCHRHIPWRTAWGSWTSAVGAGQAQCREARVAFFPQLKHLILESSEPAGVNLPSLSSFTRAQRTYLRSLYLVSYTANLVTVGDHLCSGLDCPRMTPGAGENILTQPKTDLQSSQMSLWKLKNSHLRAGM